MGGNIQVYAPLEAEIPVLPILKWSSKCVRSRRNLCCTLIQISVCESCYVTAVELVQRQAGFWHLVCGHPKWIQILGLSLCQDLQREESGIQSQEATTCFSAFSILVTFKTEKGTCNWLFWTNMGISAEKSSEHILPAPGQRWLEERPQRCPWSMRQYEDSAFPSWALWKCLPSPPPHLFPGVSHVSQCYAPATSSKCHSGYTRVRLRVPGANSHDSCS